jgi:hypothetical protein
MGHDQLSTTEIYADYAPSDREVGMVDDAFFGIRPSLGPRPRR